MTRIRRVESKREQEKLVDEFLTKGYKIEQQSQYTAKVKEKDWGSPPVHGFVFIFGYIVASVIVGAADLPGGAVWGGVAIANITYAAYSWFTADEIVIKVDEDGAGRDDG